MEKCKVKDCSSLVKKQNKYSYLCDHHRYLWQRYRSYEKPIKPPLPEGIAKICKIHGNLTLKQCHKGRLAADGKTRFRLCGICRTEGQIKRYHLNPSKHKILIWNENNKEKFHGYTILNRFNLTVEQYNKMLKDQNNLCKICKKPETLKKLKSDVIRMLAVDHDHYTMKIRGLLCHQCNIGLGAFKDSIENLQIAIDYLKAST